MYKHDCFNEQTPHCRRLNKFRAEYTQYQEDAVIKEQYQKISEVH